MNNKTIYKFIIASVVILFAGCSDLFTNPGSASSSSGKISIAIANPVTNDTIVYKSSTITYSLTKDSGIYAVELYVNGAFSSWNVANSDGSQPTVTLAFDSTYIGKRISYCLKYYDKDNNSVYSDTMSNILVADVSKIPYTPYNFAITMVSSTVLNLSWSDSTSLTAPGYEIYRKRGFHGTFSLYLAASPGVYNINDADASDTTVYYYKIRSSNTSGASAFSSIVNTYGTGATHSIAPPTGLTATAKATNVVSLKWTDDIGSENYFKIERRYSWGSYSTVGTAVKGATQYVDSANGLLTSTSYYYRIKAIAGSDSSWSNEVSVTTQ
ncbi:MAG: fibronectin type III domain-containing protein [Ignavibacteriaceae bacterium]|nr:fibronectin type III domain-containing protein [Ignavibacteriaceae bacterium]